jgi:TPR repeat protein
MKLKSLLIVLVAGMICLPLMGFGEDICELRQKAEQGDASAQFNLGVRYELGDGVPKDSKEAVKWYRLAAENGNASAQSYLGGVVKDAKESVKWYLMAAEQGDVYAQYFLGTAYNHGKGVPEDYDEAIKWYRLAADQGHAKAQVQLKKVLDLSSSGSGNYAEGAGKSRSELEVDVASAHYKRGNQCYYGSQIYSKAANYYRMAAEQGHAGAQYMLGYCYFDGQGVAQDYEKAVKQYRSAAEQGHVGAQYMLGYCYHYGQGVPQDNAEAYAWINMAAKQGDKRAIDVRQKDLDTNTMTSKQMVEGKRLFQEYTAKYMKKK